MKIHTISTLQIHRSFHFANARSTHNIIGSKHLLRINLIKIIKRITEFCEPFFCCFRIYTFGLSFLTLNHIVDGIFFSFCSSIVYRLSHLFGFSPFDTEIGCETLDKCTVHLFLLLFFRFFFLIWFFVPDIYSMRWVAYILENS